VALSAKRNAEEKLGNASPCYERRYVVRIWKRERRVKHRTRFPVCPATRVHSPMPK